MTSDTLWYGAGMYGDPLQYGRWPMTQCSMVEVGPVSHCSTLYNRRWLQGASNPRFTMTTGSLHLLCIHDDYSTGCLQPSIHDAHMNPPSSLHPWCPQGASNPPILMTTGCLYLLSIHDDYSTGCLQPSIHNDCRAPPTPFTMTTGCLQPSIHDDCRVPPTLHSR